jgi:hypothetical protein
MNYREAFLSEARRQLTCYTRRIMFTERSILTKTTIAAVLMIAQSEASATPEQMRLMLQSLLADQFKLTLHREMRDLPFYALVLSRRDGTLGPALRRSEADCSHAASVWDGLGPSGPSDPDAPCGVFAIELQFTPEGLPGRPGPPGVERPPSDNPSVFTAVQEQLGLKIRGAKGAN